MVEIGKVRFFILAKNPKQLEALWSGILSEAGAFDPAACNSAILVEAAVLPDRRQSGSDTKTQPKPSPANPSDPIDV